MRRSPIEIASFLLWVSLAGTAAAGTPAGARAGLPAGKSLFAADLVSRLKLLDHEPDRKLGEMRLVDVVAQPFARAARVRTLAQGRNDYHLELKAPTTAAVAKGDVCLLTFHVRGLASEDETGQGRLRVYLQHARAPGWTKSVSFSLSAAAKWRRFDVPFVAKGGYAAGEAELGVALAYKPQTVELGGISVRSFGRRVKLSDLPRTPIGYAGWEPDAPWRAEARRRIDKHRKAEMAVRVSDAAGRAVAGARVAVKMKRHAFGFGSAVVLQRLADESKENETYRRHVLELFNRVSSENDLKWPAWAGDWGPRFRRERTIEGLRWLKRHGFRFHGHVLVWPSWRHLARSAQALKSRPDALRKHVREHIAEVAGQTRGLVDEWDVVNEPFSNHDLMDLFGRDVMVEWFRAAREAAPKARLYINDYAILAAGGRTDTAHQRHYEQTIRFLLEKGAPLGGIGLQSHFGTNVTPPPVLWKILDRFAAFKLPLQITEFDVNTPDTKLLADYTRDFMTAVFAHPAVEGLVMWGFWAGQHWRPQAAMFRRDWSIKPNGEAYKELVFRRWWTDAQGTTDAAGRYAVRGFLGDYEVTVAAAGKTRTVKAALRKDGTVLRVALE